MTPRVHRDRRIILLVLLWLLLWAATIATWMYDADGYTVGMPPLMFAITMLGPLLVGLILGWGKDSIGEGVRVGMVGGVVYGLANMAGQLLWGGVLNLLGRIPPDTMAEIGGIGVMVFEVVEFTLLFTLTGLILGLIGGALGAWIGRSGFHGAGRSRPV